MIIILYMLWDISKQLYKFIFLPISFTFPPRLPSALIPLYLHHNIVPILVFNFIVSCRIYS